MSLYLYHWNNAEHASAFETFDAMLRCVNECCMERNETLPEFNPSANVDGTWEVITRQDDGTWLGDSGTYVERADGTGFDPVDGNPRAYSAGLHEEWVQLTGDDGEPQDIWTFPVPGYDEGDPCFVTWDERGYYIYDYHNSEHPHQGTGYYETLAEAQFHAERLCRALFAERSQEVVA